MTALRLNQLRQELGLHKSNLAFYTANKDPREASTKRRIEEIESQIAHAEPETKTASK